MYGGVWRCMEVYGGVWRCIKVYGGVWRCMGVYEGVWRCTQACNSTETIIFIIMNREKKELII